MRTGMCSLVLALAFAIPSQAQQTTPITVEAANCGRSSLPNLNCYSFPMIVGGVAGTAWIDVQGQGGFILFRPGLEGANYVEGKITSSTVDSRNAIGQATSATITFAIPNPSLNGYAGDPDNNGDSDAVVGAITINASYYYSSGGGGRAGAAGWVVTVTGGTGTQSIVQD